MKAIPDWDNITPENNSGILPAGGYVLKLGEATDAPDNDGTLTVVYDIAEGEEKGRYSDDWGKEHPYAHQIKINYGNKPKRMKELINAVEGSNREFRWTWNEKALEGKLVGAVIGHREKINDMGDVKVVTYIKNFKKIDDIRNGNFKVPELWKADASAQPADDPRKDFTRDDNIPF